MQTNTCRLQRGTSIPTPKIRPAPWAALPVAALAGNALAQAELLQPPPDLPRLADPPFIEHALFENPVPTGIVCVLIALLAIAVANRIGKPKAGLVGAIGAIFLGVAMVGVSRVVQTDREVVEARTGDLVDAVADADAHNVGDLLHREVRLTTRGLGIGWSRDRILNLIDNYIEPVVESHRVSDVQVEIRPDGYTALSRARVVVESRDWSPTPVICLLTWRRESLESDDWIVIEIEPLWALGTGQIDAGDLPRGFGN